MDNAGLRTSRRGLLGAAAAVTVGARARPAAAAPLTLRKRPDVIRHGRAVAADHRYLVAIYARRRLAVVHRGRHKHRVVLGGQPLDIAVRNGTAAITTAAWDEPGLEIVDVRTGHRRRHDAGPAPHAVAFVGGRVVTSGDGEDGVLRVLGGPILHAGRQPRGLAAHGRHAAWVALNGESAVVLVDLVTGKTRRRLATAAFPDRIAASPDGRRLLVAHGGVGAHTVTELDVRTGTRREIQVGAHPNAVAWQGHARLIAVEDSVLRIARGHRHLRAVPFPRGLAVVGRKVYTVSGTDGRVGRL